MKKHEDKSVITNEPLERNEMTEDETAMAEFSINASFYANDTHSDMPPTYINNNTPAIKISK
ncbi:hypothetical protein HNQ85_002679 [Anoxybacillus calidus]|jgi:hypothetical protein|uniref:Uncharacterized protein n=1 Tax=[Anoxybacillus] calidus TaxID=575178 RepID=A0A7V9Z1U8_9BACL|nr:hypothetical protein [Anoxybacillus calidus]MBA2872370.1 hypothetical protein [Anoxybacillus calidus]